MPTNKWFTTIPELYEPRQRLKEWLIERYPICEFSGKRGEDLHEGLVDGNALRGTQRRKIQVKIRLWKTVLHHPGNIALLNHDFHINNKPNQKAFVAVVQKRPNWFFSEFPLSWWRFNTAADALNHFYSTWNLFVEYGLLKVMPKLPNVEFINNGHNS